MEEKMSVLFSNVQTFDDRYGYLEESANMRDLSPEEQTELKELNQVFSALGKDYFKKMSTTEGPFHPGRKFYGSSLSLSVQETSEFIQECLNRGQPVVLPKGPENLIIANPRWEENL